MHHQTDQDDRCRPATGDAEYHRRHHGTPCCSVVRGLGTSNSFDRALSELLLVL